MGLLSVHDTLERILDGVVPLPPETVGLSAAHRRILATPVVARRTTPSADMSAMDGYAVRSQDVAQVPVDLQLIGEAAAGRPYAGQLRAGQAVRILTGGVLPDGADAIVIQEDTRPSGQSITMLESSGPYRHVRRAGGDFTAGEQLLPAGHRITARDLALIAAADLATIDVVRRARIGLLATGDELVPPGQGAGPHQVILSNVYALRALAEAAGAEVVDLGLLPDRLDATRAGLRTALEGDIDVLVTTGGASVGDHDFVAPALTQEGVDLAIHKIALRPGKPLMFGRRTGKRVLGLPGNPVSAYICALLFLRPLIARLHGEAAPAALMLELAELAVDLKPNEQRMDFMRARIVGQGARGPRVAPFPLQDSSMLSSLARSDVLLVRPPHAPAARAGDPCEIMRLDEGIGSAFLAAREAEA